jgi:hypothetical protein
MRRVFNHGDIVKLDDAYLNSLEVMVLSQTTGRLFTTVCEPNDTANYWEVMTNRLSPKPPVKPTEG